MKTYYIFAPLKKIPLEFKAVNVFDNIEQGLATLQLHANQSYWVFEVSRESLKPGDIIQIDPLTDKAQAYVPLAGFRPDFKIIQYYLASFETNDDWIRRIAFLMGANANNAFFGTVKAVLPNHFSQLPMSQKWQLLYQQRLSKTFMQDPGNSYAFFKVLSELANDEAKAQFNNSQTMQLFQEESLQPYFALFDTHLAKASATEKATINNWITFLIQISPDFLQKTPKVRWESLYLNCHTLKFQQLASENRALTCIFLQKLATAANVMGELNESSTLKPYLSNETHTTATSQTQESLHKASEQTYKQK
jgi:hypothetical protein